MNIYNQRPDPRHLVAASDKSDPALQIFAMTCPWRHAICHSGQTLQDWVLNSQMISNIFEMNEAVIIERARILSRKRPDWTHHLAASLTLGTL